ncbi:ABC transporter permease [Ruicaihuangia caeni]|uniref:ABC transporter permease n=1 Tax=Ruicaihuangia caeni TaxID=3042517 RepID=A0AAW6T9M3_9MICO|nr:ABC transporter permease [Klugiella sp. YN-L-19]MDI2099028.1 ABC transporter permease [Klugiella sp. YN-L-19]
MKLTSPGVRAALGWAVAVVLILAWQLAAVTGESLFFPPPTEILAAGYQLWFSAGLENGVLTDAFHVDVVPSLERLVIGVLIAVAVGVSLGVLLGRVRVVAQFVEPLLHFMRALPGPVLLPMALVLLGTGNEMRIALITFGAIWPVLFNTYSAVRQVPESYLDTATVSRRTSASTLFRVILPSASAGIFAGIRTATGLGIILLVASELVASSDGIGFGLMQSQRSFQFLEMWAFIVALSILGYITTLLLSALERLFLRWHHLYKAVVA